MKSHFTFSNINTCINKGMKCLNNYDNKIIIIAEIIVESSTWSTFRYTFCLNMQNFRKL